MTFPFSVIFSRQLEATITPNNRDKVLQYIEQYIKEDKANNIIVADMCVTYRGSTSNWRGSLFGSVDNGVFKLIHKDDSWFLNYQINMRRLFIDTAILSTIMGIFAQVTGDIWWVGIAAFLWLCGANWVTNLIRHDSEAGEIAAGIDELICGKEELPNQDKMTGKIKSWF